MRARRCDFIGKLESLTVDRVSIRNNGGSRWVTLHFREAPEVDGVRVFRYTVPYETWARISAGDRRR